MRKKTNSKHPCKGTKIDGKPCSNNAAYASEGLCKIHFLKKLHDRMTDKEDTMRTMAAPVTKNGDVWIGSLASAQHKSFLERYGIKSILNVSGIEPLPHTKKMLKDHHIKYCTFTEVDPVTKEEKYMPDTKFDDEEFTKQDFLNYAKKAISFLKNCPKPVLVNCQAGMNRSAAMIAVYLVCARGKSFEKTVHLLEKANKTRGIPALKNMHFRRMIQELDNIKKYRHRKHASSHASHSHSRKRRSRSHSHKHKSHRSKHHSHKHKRHSHRHSDKDRHHPYRSFLPYIE